MMNILGIYYLHKNGGKCFGLIYTVLSYILKEKELRLETSIAHLMMGEISRHGKKISMQFVIIDIGCVVLP